MIPLYSDADRSIAIRKFIFARSKNLAQINSYKGIKDYLEEQRVPIMCKLKKSGIYRENAYSELTRHYTEGDAKIYFEWLISVATGTRDASSETRKKAINQLFMFIFDTDNTVSADEQVTLLTPYSLGGELADFDTKISEVQKKVNRMNEQILDALKKIMDWKQKYQPYLDRIVKDQNILEKALNGNGNNK